MEIIPSDNKVSVNVRMLHNNRIAPASLSLTAEYISTFLEKLSRNSPRLMLVCTDINITVTLKPWMPNYGLHQLHPSLLLRPTEGSASFATNIVGCYLKIKVRLVSPSFRSSYATQAYLSFTQSHHLHPATTMLVQRKGSISKQIVVILWCFVNLQLLHLYYRLYIYKIKKIA